ncbi:response regulator [Geomonas anaerohicana]|uniref:Response regulator n=1 Tax=Geomonas anaerohicana TaxID=2798583 RepID=A0ABS0YFS5_9BACT|nr:response regulator [Geomonas anaerohicana]MBJ6751181.1 response regulator [Geomonas anaerohicana]
MIEGEPLCILLVEDNPDHAELAIRNLTDAGLVNHLFHVEDGEAALDYLNNRGRFADQSAYPRPHLVLLDLRLPKVDGIEVLKQVKASDQLKAIPVVILTTSAAERDLAQAYNHYANSYLTKPVDFDSFSNLLRDLGFYWLAWNRRPTS